MSGTIFGGCVGAICGALLALTLLWPALGDGVNTITVPSTVVRKFKNPRTVTVGSDVWTAMLLCKGDPKKA